MKRVGRKKIPKVSEFVSKCLEQGIVSPSQMKEEYETKYGKNLTDTAFTMALKRAGITRQTRISIAKVYGEKENGRDIEAYEQVQNYILASEEARLTRGQIEATKKELRRLWELMGKTNPNTWKYDEIMAVLKEHYKKVEDDRGRIVWEQPSTILGMLGAFNRCFHGILPKGWSQGLSREAGELKDFLTFKEFDAFMLNIDAPQQKLDHAKTEQWYRAALIKMPREGWDALFPTQVNLGAREGGSEETGILSLKWEDIDWKNKRCSLLEKGKRGHARRRWQNLPLDLFPWLHGFEKLLVYWDKCGRPSQGRVFPVYYGEYNAVFHNTRKACNGRIAGDKETFVPHVLRKTHAQWLVKLWTPIELICGQFPNGYFGVGWDSPEVLLKYYITLEGEQFERAEKIQAERMEKLGLGSLSESLTETSKS